MACSGRDSSERPSSALLVRKRPASLPEPCTPTGHPPASETPAARAISLVVVPRNPRCEKRRMATRRICRRRSSPVIRAPLAPLVLILF